MSKKQKAAFIINILIFILALFSVVSTVIGFNFMEDVGVLSDKNFSAFKYFTVDSNILAGITSLIYVIFQLRLARGKLQKLPLSLMLFKLAATTGVTLTMMVTVFFLAPQSHSTYFAYFMNSNLFMHLVIPLLAIISFIFFEPAQIKFSQSLTGIIPMLLYAFYYLPNVLLHLENGKALHKYDWYGFLAGGVWTIWLVIPIILLVTWLFALGLWVLNKKLAK